MVESCYPRGDVIHDVFRTRVLEHPGAIALITEDDYITYEELDKASDVVATRLLSMGVRKGDFIAILLPRTAELVCSMLGVLKSGSAYCILDPAWPAERTQDLLGSLDVSAIIGPTTTANSFPTMEPEPLLKLVAGWSQPAPPSHTAGDAAFSVIFTSGSTGRSKAVVIAHRGCVRLFASPNSQFDERTVLPAASAIAWDGFALEVWGPLLAGGCIVMVEDAFLTAGSLRSLIQRHSVNVVFLTATLLNFIVDEDVQAFAGLSTVCTGGERASGTHMLNLSTAHPDVEIWNLYGPTEITFFATRHLVTAIDCALPDGVPIGVPADETTVLVLSPDGSPMPDGVAGELFLGGSGLFLCYYGDDASTEAARFDLEPYGRLYRTGDFGYKREDGSFVFLGRGDRQVKLRGQRVELEEVEALMAGIPGVGQTAVVAMIDCQGRCEQLVGFFVPRDDDNMTEVRALLLGRLPAYLVPSLIVPVESLPLSSSGKTDYVALSRLADDALAGCDIESRPREVLAASPSLAIVLTAFEAILGGFCGPDTGFFEAGGRSLDLARLAGELRHGFGTGVRLTDLAKWQTPRVIAGRLNGMSSSEL
jgi:amino acid adenylation domain-containing protein